MEKQIKLTQKRFEEILFYALKTMLLDGEEANVIGWKLVLLIQVIGDVYEQYH